MDFLVTSYRFWRPILVGLIFLEETYAVLILERKAVSLRKETRNQALRSKLHDGLNAKERITTAVVRPIKLLFTQPIVFTLSVYVAFLFGYLYFVCYDFSEGFHRAVWF
jgi:hypothetical protein